MKAAVVTTFDSAPRWAEFAEAAPTRPTEEVVEVLAAGLHPRVRSQASGSHYTSTDELPLVPGVDGVGRRADGSLLYFVLGDGPLGSMAERTVVDLRRAVPLPTGVDPVLIAAAMNPAMSAWIALRSRIRFEAGKSVLVLGATGSAGQLAIQVAARLGASRVVAAGRGGLDRLEPLRALGATDLVDLDAGVDGAGAAAEVDVVLDYLWGPVTEAVMLPLLLARSDRSRALDWIEIGSVAGADIALPSAVLRQANVRILGSGQGSASTAAIVESLPALVDEIVTGHFALDTVAVPFDRVDEAWTAPRSATERVVLVP